MGRVHDPSSSAMRIVPRSRERAAFRARRRRILADVWIAPCAPAEWRPRGSSPIPPHNAIGLERREEDAGPPGSESGERPYDPHDQEEWRIPHDAQRAPISPARMITDTRITITLWNRLNPWAQNPT
jgi:hypothetical protein